VSKVVVLVEGRSRDREEGAITERHRNPRGSFGHVQDRRMLGADVVREGLDSVAMVRMSPAAGKIGGV
jgi:hypothetical protein